MNGEVSELRDWLDASQSRLRAPPTPSSTPKLCPQSPAAMESTLIGSQDGQAGCKPRRTLEHLTGQLLEGMRHLQGCSPVPLALLGLDTQQHLLWRAPEVPTG